MAKKKAKNRARRMEKVVRIEDVAGRTDLEKKNVKWGRHLHPMQKGGRFSVFGELTKGLDPNQSDPGWSLELLLFFRTNEDKWLVTTFDQVLDPHQLERLPVEFGVFLNSDCLEGFINLVLNREGKLEITSIDKDEDRNRLVDLVFTWRTFVATTQVRLKDHPEVFRFDRPED